MKSKVKDYASANLNAAHIILADAQRYQGLPLEWARTIVENATSTGGETLPPGRNARASSAAGQMREFRQKA